jgi:hypothetical protein
MLRNDQAPRLDQLSSAAVAHEVLVLSRPVSTAAIEEPLRRRPTPGELLREPAGRRPERLLVIDREEPFEEIEIEKRKAGDGIEELVQPADELGPT